MFKSYLWKCLVLLLLVLPVPSGLYAQDGFDIEDQKARELFNQGMQFFNQSSYEAAIEKFFDSLRIRSRDNLVRYYLGLAFYKGGYTQNAIDQWENIIKLGGQDAFLIQKINNIDIEGGLRAKRPQLPVDYVFVRSVPEINNTNALFRLSYPVGLTVDDNDNVFFLDYRRNTVGRITGNGIYRENLMGVVKGNTPLLGGLRKPYDIIQAGEDAFYISDFGNDRIVKIDRDGRTLQTFGEKGVGTNGQFLGPEGMAMDEHGTLYVVDSGNCRIQVFNSKGEFLYMFGKRGNKAGELMMPAGITLSPDGQEVYVCDRGNNRVSVFSIWGKYRTNFGSSYLHSPREVLFSRERSDIVTVLDAENIYLVNPVIKRHKSIFYNVNDSSFRDFRPVAMAFDSTGHLYVSDVRERLINIYAPMKLRYVNLNVQVEQVYLREFPKVMLTVSVRNREGKPVTGLETDNFELKENGVIKQAVLNPELAKYQALRTTVLVEKSVEARERQHVLKTILEEIFNTQKPADQSAIFSYSGGSPDKGDTYRKVMPFNNSILKNINETMIDDYQQDFYMGTALKKAIDINLNLSYKKGIIIIAFNDYQKDHFLPENFKILANFAARNGVSISILYAGEDVSDDDGQAFYFFRNLAEMTGGMFLVYQNLDSVKTILNNINKYQNGFYQLNYNSFENTLKSGFFRKVSVKVKYKSMTGLDNKAGYPIP